MTTLTRIASALLAAAALVFPLSSAHAETRTPAPHHHAKAESAFPMKAEAFKKLVDGQIGQLKGHMAKGLQKRSLSHGQKSEIEKAMDGALDELHAAVEKVSADGVVTRDEAKQIKALSDKLRARVRGELKGKHASVKVKGGKPAKHKAKAPPKKAEKDAPKDK